MEKNNEYMQGHMNWKKISLLYRRKIWLVVVIMAVAAAIAAGLYRLEETLTDEGQFYRVSSDYYITFNFDEYEASVDYYNAYTWDSILRDDPIVDEALKLLPGDYTKEEVKASITGEMLGDYRILTVHATHEDPVRAEEIAYAYTQSLAIFADKIEMLDEIEIWSREECLPVEEADLTVNAAILGGIIGLVLALILWTIHHVLDDSVYVESDFTERFTVPFLGMITKNGSELCKQELQDNLSYLLKEESGYYLVNVNAKKAGAKEIKEDVLQHMKELHSGMKEELSLQGEDLNTLRKSSGAVIMIPWGNKNGRLIEKTISFLQKQDCTIAGAVIYGADDKFLKRYYR